MKRKVRVNVFDNLLGNTPLHYACLRGKMKSVKFLLSKGANPFERNQYGYLPLHEAVCHPELLRFLLENVYKKKDLNEVTGCGETPLHLACEEGVVESVKLLLEKGTNPNAKDEYGRTPLHEACIYGHLEAVKLLIEKGADPNIKDRHGWMAIDHARWHEHPEIVEYLSQL